ncbi:MAG: STAS domain-containing protein [Woeseiaceae bacterium]|nr:STAS domain-containing protein [Woeseiaceae bacterium]
MQANNFELEDLGEGRFALRGDMSFETAERILHASEDPFEDHTSIEVDLSGVKKADSAGLALLLEWITWANHTVREISFVDMPERILAIAKTTEVDHLLNRGERWAGFIEAPEDQD